MNPFARFWNQCDLKKPPYIHPDDLEIIDTKENLFDRKIRTHNRFVKSDDFGMPSDRKFHLSLLPVPYVGDLDRADIFVLMLNPGLGLSAYFTGEDSTHAKMTKRIIRQKLTGVEFPFISLDPRFCWSGGFAWWEKKLRSILRKVANEKFEGRYLDALKHLSQRLACIELVPYRSNSFGGHSIIKELASTKEAIKYVHDALVPRAQKGEITLIATRQCSLWALPKGRNIVTYSKGQTRGASLGAETKGGQAILRQIKSSPL